MRNLGAVLILAAACVPALSAAGCTGVSPWESQVQEPEYYPPPPERLLRRPPDFRLRDLDNRREFFLYFHEDQEYREEVVTVVNYDVPEPQRRPRLALIHEHEYALSLFVRQWKSRSDAEKLRYFNEMHLQEMRRNATLLDQEIRMKEAAVQDLQEKKIALEADLKSRQDTGAFAEGSEKFSLISSQALQNETARNERRLATALAELMVLRHFRAERDAEFGRHAAVVFVSTTFDVRDLLPRFSSPQRLADTVRTNVLPASWQRSQAWIEVVEGHLVVRQTQEVMAGVQQYLEKLRIEMEEGR